jgi:hypothetical protein
MTDGVPDRSFSRMTWREFIDLLRPHGIVVDVMPIRSARGAMVPGYHLVRTEPKPTTTYPLPLKDHLDSRVGPNVIYAVCEHFGIDPHFPGWTLML